MRLHSLSGFALPSLVLPGLLFGGLALFAGCSSGGGSDARSSQPGCASSSTFCLVTCNLGCTTAGSCAVNSIAQNQNIELVFSQAIDPSSVTSASISLKTAAGETPSGSFVIDGNRIVFVPEARLIAGITTFGFRSGEEYVLTLPGGTEELQSVRSNSGDRLARTVACRLGIGGGLVDLNSRPPQATLISPSTERNVPPNPTIIIEFDELIDTAPFQGGTTASSPIQYLLRRIDPATGEADPSQPPILVPGVPQAETILGVEPRTRILLQPIIDLPSSIAVEVVVTDQVRDISGTPAQQQIFRFYTQIGTPVQQTVTESFAQPDKLDPAVSSARWGNNALRPGTVGGAGKHGEFDITMLPQIGGEFVWDVDQPLTIPSNQTLLGAGDLVINNGMAEFASFNIAENQVLRLRGSTPNVIRVSGRANIEGRILADAPAPPTVPSATPIVPAGAAGGQGNLGGGRGGRGAQAWLPQLTGGPPFATPTAANRGVDGETLQAPASSGYAGQVAGTGGAGAPWHPASGLYADVNESIENFYSSQQITGGGGGGYLVPGGAGTTPIQLRMPTDPPNTVAPPAAGGAAVSFMMPPANVDSLDHFTVGGSGGGGGGSAASLIRKSIQVEQWNIWTNGHGGGGGGGAFALRVGRELSLGLMSTLSARGGSGRSSLMARWTDRQTSPAGGGSGGSIILQVGGSFTQNGTIDLRGGTGGVWAGATPGGRPGQSNGGDGAPGYIRLEAPGANTTALGLVNGPTLDANNVGPIGSEDPESVARSRWYPLNSLLPPRLLYYEVNTVIDGVPVVFTDDPARLNLANVPGAPVFIKLQGAELDLVNLVPDGLIGPWVNTASELGFMQPTGFRFLMILDTTTASSIVVESFRLVYEV